MKSLKMLIELYKKKCLEKGFNGDTSQKYMNKFVFADAINEYIKPQKPLVLRWSESDYFELNDSTLVLKYYKGKKSWYNENGLSRASRSFHTNYFYDEVVVELID
jgi:Uma2 family endonuclease